MQQPTNITSNITSWRVTEPEIMDTDKYLSSANAPDMEEDARLCIESGARNMVLNCSQLAYMTGAGLRAVLNISRLMQQAGGKLSITDLNGQPRELFFACGMDALIPLADEAADSLALAA